MIPTCYRYENGVVKWSTVGTTLFAFESIGVIVNNYILLAVPNVTKMAAL